MELKVDIKKIYLGKATAENEKEDLHKYFLSTRAYLNAKDERKRKLFYIGHRGAGKSALFNQLTYEYLEGSKNILIPIKPAEYSYETFRKLQHDFYDVKAAYSIAWHYTLLIQMFIEVSRFFKENKETPRVREHIKTINNYLLDNGFKDAETKLEVFLEFLSRINISKLKVRFKGFELEGERDGSKAKDLVNLLNMKDIKKPISALERIVEAYPIYIFIDELDTGWNNTVEAKNFISGLIYGANKINQMQNISVFLSLRQDMYNNLADTFKDTEKMRDEIEFLRWEKYQLKALISNRISENKEVKDQITRLNNLSNDEILGIIFEDKVFDHIISCTLERPREVIHLCNKCIDKYAETYLNKGLFGRKIGFETVKEVEKDFSMDRFNDYCSEYNDEFFEIKTLFIGFEGCPSTFSKKDFVNRLEVEMIAFIEEIGEQNWIKFYIDNPEKLLAKLFDIGFVKLSVTNGREFFAYYESKPLNFRNITHVQINNVFRPALKCTQN